MQCKHGLRSDLRSPGRSFLTLFLFFLVTARLGSSLGTFWSVRETLRTLSRSYVTIATAVLDSGAETPDPAAVSRAAAELDALALPEGALSWAPNRFAQAWLSEAPEIIDNASVSDYGVVLVRTMEPGPFSTRSTLPAVTLKSLFSVKDVEGKNLELYAEALEADKSYLVYGRWYVGTLGAAFCMEALEPPLKISDSDNWQQTPGAQVYADLAERLEVRRNSVRALFPEDPLVCYPFQQKAVQLSQGRSFTPEELAEGAKVCMIPEKLATLEGLELGDRLPLSLAVGNDPDRSDSYDPVRGFDLEAEYEIVGLLHTKYAWKNTIFLPPRQALDLSRAKRESLLGQFLLDNDRADEFIRVTESALPDGVRLTVYDQGYGEAAEPLRLMLRTVSLIALTCSAAGLCFLLLNLWLFVSRQRQAGVLMHRLGAPRSAVPVYFLSAMLPLALPALAGGIWFSQWASGAVTRLLGESLTRDPGVGSRFSDAKLSLRQTVALMEAPVSLSVYLAAAGMLLLLSCLLCWLLAERTLPRLKPRSRMHSLRTRTRTRALRGGASKYALLSARRGGFRSAVTLLAPLAAVLLLCGLNQTRQSTALRLRNIEENTEIRGYFTDLNGRGAEVALLKYRDLSKIMTMPETSHITATNIWNLRFHFVSALHREEGSIPVYEEYGEAGEPLGEPIYIPGSVYTLTGPLRLPEIPYGKFQNDRLQAQSLRQDPPVISANSMEDLPRLMFRNDGAVRWLDGYSDQSLRWTAPAFDVGVEGEFSFHTSTPSESWEAEQQKLREIIDAGLSELQLMRPNDCVLSEALLAEWGLSLGDYFLSSFVDFFNTPSTGCVYLRVHHVIGVYPGASPQDPIYVQSQYPFDVGEEILEDLDIYGQRYLANYPRILDGPDAPAADEWMDYTTVSSAVFRFKASDLEGLKQRLEALGLTEVGDSSGARRPFLLEDQVFLATKRSVEQRLWYMERIFPVVSGLVLALAVLLSVLQLLARRREIWLMHCTGTGRARSFASLFVEQLGLCLLGLAAGLGLCAYLNWLTPRGAALALIFGGLWLSGFCGMALYLTRHPVKTNRDE